MQLGWPDLRPYKKLIDGLRDQLYSRKPNNMRAESFIHPSRRLPVLVAPVGFARSFNSGREVGSASVRHFLAQAVRSKYGCQSFSNTRGSHLRRGHHSNPVARFINGSLGPLDSSERRPAGVSRLGWSLAAASLFSRGWEIQRTFTTISRLNSAPDSTALALRGGDSEVLSNHRAVTSWTVWFRMPRPSSTLCGSER